MIVFRIGQLPKRPQSGARFFCDMTKFILGTKGVSEQMYDESGLRIPVTYIQTPNCYLIDMKTNESHGYWSIKLGTDLKRSIAKPQQGELKKAGINAPLRFLREIRIKKQPPELIEKDKKKGIKLGDKEFFFGSKLNPADIFHKDDLVNVTGTSKGKGFQGVVRRHKFSGGPRTHGQSDRERAPGSIGATTTPGRVLKGKRMAGRMGGDTITVKNLRVIEVGDSYIKVKGLVPGAKKDLIIVKGI